jgi:hypothetical protein
MMSEALTVLQFDDLAAPIAAMKAGRARRRRRAEWFGLVRHSCLALLCIATLYRYFG